MLIPSIDIMDGKAVQLINGKEKKIETEVWEKVEEFSVYPLVNIIDLDAALGKGSNKELIKKICKRLRCNVGGGIRTKDLVQEYIKAGASKVIIGTCATKEFLSQINKDFVIVALDSKNEEVVDKGWTNSTKENYIDRAKELNTLCSEFLFTDVNKEGLMNGINIDAIKKLKDITTNKINYAGGVSTAEEIKQLEDLDINSVVGMSIYTDTLNLIDSWADIIKFNNLIPTIVKDDQGQTLMLAYSSKESFQKTLMTRKCTYFSRSRNSLWTKGETSKNYQTLTNFNIDCDNDTIIYTVGQYGVACHTGMYSCFGDKEFNLKNLYLTIKNRFENPKENSYTSRLTEEMIKEKLLEEVGEVVNYTDRSNLVWECGDMLYFLLSLMAKKGIDFNEVISELRSRTK